LIIEQSKEQMHDAVALHTGATIRSIRLAQSTVWCDSDVEVDVLKEVAFDINFKPGAFRVRKDQLNIETDFRFVITSESPATPVFKLECRFEAQYGLVEGFEPSEKQIEAFQAANAVFNCWPFFREYVQNTATRMSLPPPPVPFLRIVRKQDVASQAIEAPTSSTAKKRVRRT
jgi:hypothetical protein